MYVITRARPISAFLVGLALIIGVITPALAAAQPSRSASASQGASNANGDTILVKIRAGRSPSVRAALHQRHGGQVVGEIAALGVQLVRVSPGRAAAAVRAYGAEADVQFAESDSVASVSEVPNDPSYSLQWGLAKIGAPTAWGSTHGAASTIVAILDTGISQAHPDLASKVVLSQNFSDSATLDDLYGHGSHVAGIAAAVTNNATGVAGLGWGVSLANVKVLGDNGTGLYSAVSSGIVWATDHGANVINLSLGGTSASSTLEAAVNYAWGHGVVVVAAAGNNASSSPFYPAYYTNSIAVAAVDNLDHLAAFSDFGAWVDVAAPGVSIYATVPGGYGYKSGTSMASPFVAGLAALIWSQTTDSNTSGLRNDEVRSRIESTAAPVGLAIGGGRIDAGAAVQTAPVLATGTISGHVTNASTAQALAGATVSDGTHSVGSDASGAYTLSSVTPGTITLRASAAGYAGASQTVSVSAGQTTSADIALSPLSSPYLDVKSITFKLNRADLVTSVLVLDGNGTAVGGAAVSLTETRSGTTTTLSVTLKTNASGVTNFTWKHAAKGTYTATVTKIVGPYPWDPTHGLTSAQFTL
jgi:thermitase